ncbi:hypothetical protein [Maritalea sp.]|uniref:hypothetical protein n=1 Tax=Maritalea sp. TaxID=2003361 RepID=UPI003EF91039
MSKNWPRWQSALIYALKDISILRNPVAQKLIFETARVPHFESDDIQNWFSEQLKNCQSYLEFGSGGTTFLAAEFGIPFVSKESDLLFSLSVQRTIELAGFHRAGQTYIHADIGLTENWGYPFSFSQPTAKRLKKFTAYSDVPDTKALPDLVLIDGRFRVACMLKCVKALAATDNWTIAFDDYQDRPHYHVVAQFAELTQMVGRMAVFVPKQDIKMAALEKVLSGHLYDYR